MGEEKVAEATGPLTGKGLATIEHKGVRHLVA
jgi:hypothetical protein